MIIFERRLGGLLRYRSIFYPAREMALQIVGGLGPRDLLRLFGVAGGLGEQQRLIRHRGLLTTCIDLSAGLDAVYRGMKAGSCRYMIRRAEKLLDRVSIEVNSDKASRDFLRLYNGFARRKGPVPRLSPRQFGEYARVSDVLVLYFEERPACCHMLLRDGEAKTVRLLYSGSRRLETPEDAANCGVLNRYLHWHEMQRYHADGIVTYDFGGIRDLSHPTAKFKLSFGGAVVTEHYYLFAGMPWLGRFVNSLYERFSRAAAPARQADSQ